MGSILFLLFVCIIILVIYAIYLSYKLGCKTIAILIATGEAVFSFLRNSVIVAAFVFMTFKL